MSNIQAQLKILDSYVKEYSIKVDKKIDKSSEVKLNGKLGFRIVDISKNDSQNYIGEIELINEIQLCVDDEIVGNIHILQGAIFEAKKDLPEETVKEMLQYNAAPTVYSIMRAYINANTSLSNMPAINIPMINFVEFFKGSKKDN